MNKQRNSKPIGRPDWLLAAALMLVPGAALSQPFPEPDWVGIIRYEAWEGYYPTEVLIENSNDRTAFNAHVLRARVVMRIEGPERTTMKVVHLKPTNWTKPVLLNDAPILVELLAPRNGRFGERGTFPAEMGVQYQEMRRTILPPGEYVREGNTPEKNRASIYAQAYEKSRGSLEFLGLGMPSLEGANADYEQFAEQVLLPRLRRGAAGNAAKEFQVDIELLFFRKRVCEQRGNREGEDSLRREFMARILEVDQAWPEDRRADFRLVAWLNPRIGVHRDDDRDFLLRLAYGARNIPLRVQAIAELDYDPGFAPHLIPLLDDPEPLVVIEAVRSLDTVRNLPPWKQKRIPGPVWNPNGGIENLEEIKRAWKSG